MASSITKHNVQGGLELVESQAGQFRNPTPGTADLLTLARTLSEASTIGEVRTDTEHFMSLHIGPCRLFLPGGNSSAHQRLRDSANWIARDGKPQVTTLDGVCFVAVPVTRRSDQASWVVVEFPGLGDVTPGQREIVEFAALAASRECARIDTRKRIDGIDGLSFIHRVGQQLALAPDVSSMGWILQQELSEAVDSTFFAMVVEHEDPTLLETVTLRRLDGGGDLGFLVPIEGSKAGEVYKSGEALLIDDVLEDPKAYGKDVATWRSLIIVPLVSGSETFGAILVGHEQAGLYAERDLHVVELMAYHIGGAIYRMLDDERSQAQYRAIIEALAVAVDLRDPFTHAHSIRVAELARRLALHLGLATREADQLELAGLLHDIGKIGVPDRVLSKPGPLDPEERMVIMQHAELGAKIIDESPLLASLEPIVRHHHEWFDGRGYPDGLRGDEIPIGSAILAVAGAVETMTSNRVYRSAMSIESAAQELRNGSGNQFDPVVATGMIELLEHDEAVRRLLVCDRSTTQSKSTSHLPMNMADAVHVRVMQRIAAEVGMLTEIDIFLKHVYVIVRDELAPTNVVIWLFNQNKGVFEYSAGEIDLPAPQELETSNVQVNGYLVHSEKIMILSRSEPDSLSNDSVLIPMFVEDSLIGLIELVLERPGEVAGRDVDLLHAIAAPIGSTVRVAQLHDQAKRAAMTDGLTGVLNHRAFYERLDDEISGLNPGQAIHLLIVDVIGLKAINDTYGHLVGDLALKAVADALVERLGPRDIVARYGGDEFAMILRGEPAMPLADIVGEIEAPVTCIVDDELTLEVELRCGSAQAVDRDARAAELVAHADAVLYQRVPPSPRILPG